MDAYRIEFDRAIQNIGPLREAAYRLIGVASCVIETTADHYVVRLELNDAGTDQRSSGQDARMRFIDLVTDENLREKIAAETTGVRNVILALAFGAMSTQKGSATDS